MKDSPSGTLINRPLKQVAAAIASGDVVRSCIHGPSRKTTAAPPTASILIEALQAGLVMQELEVLRRSLDLPMDRLAPMLGISKATLHRRKASGRLDPPSPTASCASLA